MGGNSRREFNGKLLRARSMHATQHLAEREVERAKIPLATLVERRFMVGVLAMRTPLMGMRIGARMPRSMYERALLRNQQQEHA